MTGKRKKTTAIGQHPNKTAEQSHITKGIDLFGHAVFLIKEPPGRTPLYLSCCRAIIEIADHNGIESIAYKHGYNVIIAQSRESFDRELLNLQFLTSRSIDGLIISVSTQTTDFSYLKELHQKGLPIVFFDRIVSEIETHKVIVDNYKGAYDATVHLINSGSRRIAAISNPEILSITKERLAGYKAALSDYGMEINDSLIKYCQHGGMIVSEIEDVIRELFTLKQKPDAIFASADKLTTGCLRILKSKGIRVPDDMGLIGFSNTDLTDLLSPPLSVIKQPAFEMGEVATNLLLQLIESKRPVVDFETKVLLTELLIRDSTKIKKKKADEFA